MISSGGSIDIAIPITDERKEIVCYGVITVDISPIKIK